MNKRILINTSALYIRQALIVLINLYVVRIVLNNLGVSDFGVYNVVIGVTALLSFIPSAMTTAIQRFFSYAIGKDNKRTLASLFSVTVIFYVLIVCAAVLLLETVGLWFVDNHLELADDRFESARVLFHTSIFAFVCTIITSPFIAIIVAHEDMKIYAYISIMDSLLKLAAAVYLTHASGDKLIVYGYLVLAASTLTAFTYLFVCIRKYRECQFKPIHWESSLFYEIIRFSGWTLFGFFTSVLRGQAITLLINQMFTPVTVAARVVAMTVANQFTIFTNNLTTSLYPPIVKSYAKSNHDEMNLLISEGSKISFFLIWIFSLPMIVEAELVLTLWLITPPVEAVLFTQLALIESLLMALGMVVGAAARASGNIRLYEIALGSIQVLIFVFTLLLLQRGLPAYTVFIVGIVANLIMLFVRLYLVEKLVGFKLLTFIKRVFPPIIYLVLASSTSTYLLKQVVSEGLLSLVLVTSVSMIVSALIMYWVGIDKRWKKRIRGFVSDRLSLGAA